ncbi:hypothetical protein DFAR_670011 [Desulfarculales bacterium]
MTSLGVILKAHTDYRFLHQQELMGKQVAPSVDRRRFEAELPNDIWQRVTPCMGRCSWWATNGARLTFSPSSTT